MTVKNFNLLLIYRSFLLYFYMTFCNFCIIIWIYTSLWDNKMGTCCQAIIEYLLSRRADCRAQDANGTQALLFAAAQDRLEAARRLAGCHLAPGARQAARGHQRLTALLSGEL